MSYKWELKKERFLITNDDRFPKYLAFFNYNIITTETVFLMHGDLYRSCVLEDGTFINGLVPIRQSPFDGIKMVDTIKELQNNKETVE